MALASPNSTLGRHLNLLQAIFLIQTSPAWSGNLGKRLVKMPKLFLGDMGARAVPFGEKFLDRGGVIVWGMVPTGFEAFAQEEIPSLVQRLEDIWQILWAKGIDREMLISQSMLSPATCCLINPDKEKTVERAFAAVNQMADVLRNTYNV